MIELITELEAASSFLENALDRYLNACTAVQVYYTHTATLASVPRILSDRVASEMTRASLHKTRIKQANSIIGRARNLSTTLVPIHTLPSELLSRIFLLVVGESCGITASSTKSRHMPRYPDYLSHVSSRWRRVAIDLPALWTHIDLVYYHSSDHMYVNRARIFVSRAASLPLDIHIRAPTSPDAATYPSALYNFLPYITARARSLELVTPSTTGVFDEELFENLFSILEPATLLQFCITDHANYAPGYIYASHDDDEDAGQEPDYECQYLDIAYDLFEGLLLPVKVLRLDGLYPHFASQAYRGLVELCLEKPRARTCGVSAAQLYNIFLCSPRLVILHFGLEIFENDWQDIAPAHLRELETLNVGGVSGLIQLELLLKLFTPGSKPLQVTMSLYDRPSFLDHDTGVTRLLRDSNITRLCLRGLEGPVVVDNILYLLPRLRILAISGHYLDDPVGPFISAPSRNRPPCSLHALYLEKGRFDLNSLCLLAGACSPQTIVLWQTQVRRDATMLDFEAELAEEYDEVSEEIAELQVQESLLAFCPFVKHVRYDMDKPTKDWGFRDNHY